MQTDPGSAGGGSTDANTQSGNQSTQPTAARDALGTEKVHPASLQLGFKPELTIWDNMSMEEKSAFKKAFFDEVKARLVTLPRSEYDLENTDLVVDSQYGGTDESNVRDRINALLSNPGPNEAENGGSADEEPIEVRYVYINGKRYCQHTYTLNWQGKSWTAASGNQTHGPTQVLGTFSWGWEQA